MSPRVIDVDVSVVIVLVLSVNLCLGKLPESCFQQTWPNVTSCVEYSIEGKKRVIESNSVPPFGNHFVPYCPYGPGKGYCMPGETDCPFKGMICPAQHGAPSTGDVIKPSRTMFNLPANPDPTASDAPRPMFHENDRYKWFAFRKRRAIKTTNGQPPSGHPPDTIGVHVTGVTLFGPSEAGGYNVDIAGLHLTCGGHITPPIRDSGCLYHFHTAPNCTEIATKGQHGPLIGWALDGFGIYGFNDVDGKAPILDQCNGHFGFVPPSDNLSQCPRMKSECSTQRKYMCENCARTCACPGNFAYHYHAMPNITNFKNTTASPFQPYMMGCQGPSKSKCALQTEDPRQGVVWCGKGCGYDLCIQPGSKPADLTAYIKRYADVAWLDKYSINPYS